MQGHIAITWLLIIGLSIANSEQGHWRKGYEDHGTVHEQMGQSHWGYFDYTKFEGIANYTEPKTYPTYGMKRVFNASHKLLETMFHHQPSIPVGYISVKDDDTLTLGQKVEFNDWQDFVSEYVVIFILVCLLLFMIVLLPFIAVCYCCFCCCRRCNPGCPPCDRARDLQCMLILGLLLLLLIILMICGALIAVVSNRLLDRGIQESAKSVQHGNEDVCIFLKHTKDHIHHLFSNNYEELVTHITNILTQGQFHISLDLIDTSGGESLEELARILDNMPEALKVVVEVNRLEKQIRFLGDQLRDGVRNLKREMNTAYSYMGEPHKYFEFLHNSVIEFIDTSKCLHFDEMPDTSTYVQGVKDIIEGKYNLIPKEAVLRYQTITEAVKKNLDKIAPLILIDLAHGRSMLLQHSNEIQDIIDAVISDLHLNSLRTAKSFEDFYDKFGTHRSIVNYIVTISVLLIAIILLVGLVFGCFFSRATGAVCLLFGMILIFLFISFITLVALLYFIIGIITYNGGCLPFKDKESNEIYRQLDAMLDVNRFMSKPEIDAVTTPPLRGSNAIAACEAHQTIFQVLLENRLFDINRLQELKILRTESFDPIEDDSDFSGTMLLTYEELETLTELGKGNLSTYHSDHYLDNICKDFTFMQLGGSSSNNKELATRLRALSDDLQSDTSHANIWRVRNLLYTQARALDKFQSNFLTKLTEAYDKLQSKLAELDKLISYHSLSFGSSIVTLLHDVDEAQLFIQARGKEFISSILTNLTDHTRREVDQFLDKLISDCNTQVGICEPIAYIYYRSVKDICARLVDPINGFWLGLLPCALLMLPALFIAHRLLCLFKKHTLISGGHFAEIGRSCPVCTGLSRVAAPIVAESFGPPGRIPRQDGGDILELENATVTETSTELESELSLNKRKQE